MAMAADAPSPEAAVAVDGAKGGGAVIVAGGGGGFSDSDWAEMLPEALARIFAFLPLEERMKHAPLVCRSWRRASMDPACWKSVDLHEWSRLMQWEVIHRMVGLVVERSACKIEELSVCRLANDDPIDYMAERGHALKVLRIPFCQVSDFCIQNIAPSLRFVTHLDISGCGMLTKLALAAIGQSCKSLVRLDRNMSFFNNNSLQPDDYDDEALAIAKSMPLLKHLELCHGSLSNSGLLAILDNCKQLSFLDLRGCFNLEIEGKIAERCSKLELIYKQKFSDQYELEDFMSELQDDVFSDDGWGDLDEWYSSSDDIDYDFEDCVLRPLTGVGWNGY